MEGLYKLEVEHNLFILKKVVFERYPIRSTKLAIPPNVRRIAINLIEAKNMVERLRLDHLVMEIRLKLKDMILKMKDIDLNEEKDLRLRLQTLLNVGEVAEKLLYECYPSWAMRRPSRSFDQKYFELMFINNENPTVVAMKSFIRRNGLTEDDFVEALTRALIIMRNDAIIYPRLLPEEKEQAYNLLKKQAGYHLQVVLDALLYYSTKQMSKLGVNKTVDEAIKQNTNEQRQYYCLMRISELAIDSYDGYLKKQFDKFADRENIPKAIAFFAAEMKQNDDVGYIIFNSLNDALPYWEKRDELELGFFEKESITIGHVERDSFFNNQSWVKIQCPKSTPDIDSDFEPVTLTTPKLNETYNTLEQEMYSIREALNASEVLTSSENQIVYVACSFQTFNRTMRGYELLKKTLKKLDCSITIQSQSECGYVSNMQKLFSTATTY